MPPRITKTANPANPAGFASPAKEGRLILVATPIGNLGDLAPRAAAALTEADIIACEDTRHTGRMLARLGITARKRIAYHDHSGAAVRERLITAMQNGAHVALVSDAGTPLINDPGFRLVAACHAEGITVTTIPGASSVLAALVISGMPTDRFFFGGFVATRKAARQKQLGQAMGQDCTTVFFESPRRLAATLKDCAAIDCRRAIAIAREMTKIHEEVMRGTAEELAARLAKSETPLKGEIVLVIDGAKTAGDSPPDEKEIIASLKSHMAKGISRRDAVRMVSEATALPRKKIYALSLAART